MDEGKSYAAEAARSLMDDARRSGSGRGGLPAQPRNLHLLEVDLNINFTALSRNLRLFAAPALLLAASLILSLCAASYTTGTSPVLDMLMHTFGRLLSWAALACFAVGGAWYGYNLWQLYRWERGDLIGGCAHCAGPMSHLSGRFGAYSKCKMCGSKRSGWH